MEGSVGLKAWERRSLVSAAGRGEKRAEAAEAEEGQTQEA